MREPLFEFVSDMARRQLLAARTKTNPSYLWQVATGRRRASPELARQIESATTEIGPFQVPKASVRPDLWNERVGKKQRKRLS